MKRAVKFIILSLVLVVVLPMFGGCESCMFSERKKAEKYCNDYLAAIPVEYEGYKIRYCQKNGDVYEDSNIPERRGGSSSLTKKKL